MDSLPESKTKSKEENQNKPKFDKNLLINIKNNFILRRILDYVKEKISLTIFKYNKKIQKKLYLNLEYYHEFSQIAIEIIPVPNKFGNFINILNEEEKKYYHIYFNDSNVERKRNKLIKGDKVSKINIIIEHKVKSFYKLFEYCKCIESITFRLKLDTINNMSCMFFGCPLLKEIKFIHFNTSNVTDMSYMFSGCSKLEQLDVGKFITNNVTNMSHMFNECSLLEELDLSKFKIDKVINMSHMFSWCSSLEKLKIFKINKNNKNNTDMSWMFNGCWKKLKKRLRRDNKNIRIEAFD